MQDSADEVVSELPADVTASPLYSPDLAPVPKARRVWTTYNFAALWISMAHCIPTYQLAGGLLSKDVGMNWWQALLTIGLGNIIVLGPILLNAHPGTKYGISFPVLARASFGTRGANVPAVLRAIVACGWFGINVYFGGEAMKTFTAAAWPGFADLGKGVSLLGLSVPSAITFLVFWTLNILIILRGMNAVRIFENWAAPVVLVMALVLLAWIVGKAGTFGPAFSRPSQFSSAGEFWVKFAPSLTAMVAFWSTLALNVPDFTRYGRGQKEQLLGQTLGLPTTMIAFSAMALVITSASEALLAGADAQNLWNPEYVLSQITSATPPAGQEAPLIASGAARVVVALISLVGIAIATVSVNIAANVVSPANDFANLSPRHISFKTGSIITGVLGIALLPWKLLATFGNYVFTWLIGYSALLGPIAGIMIADYWIIRRRELHVEDLYREKGRYPSFNPVAIGALVLAILPNLPGFLGALELIHPPAFFSAIYAYAYFIGFILAALFYVVGTRLFGRASAPAATAR